ncbi:MAG TPA: hypothetical protein VF550_01705 [Polyangia bacterium]
MSQSLVFRPSLLLTPLLVASLACDGQPEGPAPDSPLGPALTRKAVTSPSTAAQNEGRARVEVVINSAPRVDAMASSSGRVSSRAPVTVTVTASDADQDPLAFAWTSSCPGTFNGLDKAQVTFVCGTLSAGTDCTFQVVVSDSHGGVGKGNLVLSSAIPVLNVAPAMGVVYQTTNAPDPAEVVLLHASAVDPEGQPLSWTWQASDGALSDQKDQTGSSDVHWTAPKVAGTQCTITATTTDPGGASAFYVFRAQVVGS